jgi:hypothetical protein
MDLVREIVEILSDTHPNLENALIKTKVCCTASARKGTQIGSTKS